MRSEPRIPEMRCCVGDRQKFAIDFALCDLDVKAVCSVEDATSVLRLTDGYATFFVRGVNVFQLDDGDDGKELHQLTSHCPLSLSMFLEWVFHDKAYLPEGSLISFEELIAGESSPPITFGLVDDVVHINWNFEDWSRNGFPYKTAAGDGSISYKEYLSCLEFIVEILISACEWRAIVLGCHEQWHKWLDGYQPERDSFRKYVTSAMS